MRVFWMVCLPGAVSAGAAWPSLAVADAALRLTAPSVERSGVAPARRSGIVDRIVAVVDGDPVLLSELVARARPLVVALPAGEPAWRRAASLRRIYRELLPRLVEDRVIAHAAERAGIVVDGSSVDAVLALWAAQQSTTPAALLGRAREAGADEADVRDEVRRTLVERRLFWRDVSARGGHVADGKAGATALEREQKQWRARLVARASVQVLFSP